jgi:hypothetical protein
MKKGAPTRRQRSTAGYVRDLKAVVARFNKCGDGRQLAEFLLQLDHQSFNGDPPPVSLYVKNRPEKQNDPRNQNQRQAKRVGQMRRHIELDGMTVEDAACEAGKTCGVSPEMMMKEWADWRHKNHDYELPSERRRNNR